MSAAVLLAALAAEPATAASPAPSIAVPPAAASPGAASPPEVAWIEAYAAADDGWYQHQDLAWCDGAMSVALIQEDHDPATPPSNRLWLYRVGTDGGLLSAIEIAKPEAGIPGRPADVRLVENLRLECGPEGGTVLIFNFPEGVPWWVHLDAAGAVKSSRRVGGADFLMKLADLVPAPEGGYLLLGWGPETALALRLDAEGRSRSEIVRDYGFQDAFVGGRVRPDGSLLLVANSLGDDPLASGEPLVWLTELDAGGEVRREIHLSGRFGALAAGPGMAGETLVYDRSVAGEQSIWAVAFDRRLEPVWELPVSNLGGILATPYTVGTTPDGSLLVLGNREDHAQLTKIDAGGRRAWTYFAREWGRSLDFRLGIDEDGGAYVLLSEFLQGDYLGFRRKIKLAKVAE